MSGGQALLVATIAAPLALLLACLWPGPRRHVLALLAAAPLPGLAAAILAAGAPPLVLDADRLRLTLELDRTGALLLGASALLWSAAGAYAMTWFAGRPGAARFGAFWLLTMTGSLGVFVAGDLATFYLMFGLVSLAAYVLVVEDATRRARHAGVVYLVLAILGELALLLAFVLLAVATPGQSLAIRDAMAALPDSPSRDVTIQLLLVGFGLKAGLAPFHVWLPVAHPAAPMPASAVLSGAIIKAGIIGLLRFLPYDTALPGLGLEIAVIGIVSVFYAVAVGITQANPKTVLAYSSMSQMGLVAAMLGMALSTGTGRGLVNAAFYAAHHVLAKGALFLAVGVVATSGARRLWPVLLPAAVLVLGFAGLPLTGGQVAKTAAKDLLGDGVIGLLGILSGATTTLLMVHFLFVLRPTAASDADARPPAGLVLPWLATAAAAILLPWLLLPLSGLSGWAEVFTPAALWGGLWPVLLGAALAWALRRWGRRLPRVPEGDVLLPAERALQAAAPLGGVVARMEAALRAWPAAGLSLLVIALAFGVAMLASPR